MSSVCHIQAWARRETRRAPALDDVAVALGEQLEARGGVDQAPGVAVDRRPADLADPRLQAGAVRDRDLAHAGLAGPADRLPLVGEVDRPPALDRDAAVLAAVDDPLQVALGDRDADRRAAGRRQRDPAVELLPAERAGTGLRRPAIR